MMGWGRFANPFQLQPRPSAAPAGRRSTRLPKGVSFIGMVVNPKLRQPVFATTDDTNVGLRSCVASSLLQKLGSGYYGSWSDMAAQLSGYPRSHTPSGVTIRGSGYGTCLYTALCLGAHQHYTGTNQDLIMSPKADGISSMQNDRSYEADAWWNSAVKLNVASSETSGEEEEEVDVSDDVSPGDLSEATGKNVTYVRQVVVDVEEVVEYNTYDWDSAEHHDLVVGGFATNEEVKTVRSLWESMRDEWDPDDLNEDALLALDVRGLDPEVINLVSVMYQEAEIPEVEIDNMRWRWQNNLDPDAVAPAQLRLWPNPVRGAMQSVIAARKRTGWNRLGVLP